ncbi:MAG TPA: cation:proton antiporter [Bordetella sp.]|nr:cation:proton antiporter [Bordetella sp.]
MPHSTPLITTIVGGLVLAFILAGIAVRLKLPPLIGYLCAGIVCGPYTPGFTADSHLANELAELGVILLMFGVGLHFSLRDLLSVKSIAVPGAIVQIVVATAMGLGMSWMMGWTMGAGLLFGLALSVASTVVLIKAMEDSNLVDTSEGRIAIGWLIVEDLAMVAALVLIPALSGALGGREEGGGASLWVILGLTAIKVAAFVAIMLVIGRRVIPWLLERVVYTGNRELFRLGVLACALGIAYGATALFGVSFALGAFFAGMVMAESEFSQRAADESLPLRDAFSVLFFVSVGMLFDPMVLLRDPWGVLGTFLIILVGKSIASYLIVRAFRHPKLTALTISASLAQIGEFSFILAGLGVTQEILPKAGQDLVLAGAILTILVNPLLFNALDRYRANLERARVRPEEPDPGV